jgi:hypothetical protein
MIIYVKERTFFMNIIKEWESYMLLNALRSIVALPRNKEAAVGGFWQFS